MSLVYHSLLVGKSQLIAKNSSKRPLSSVLWRYSKQILTFSLDRVLPGTFFHLHINLVSLYSLSIPRLLWDAQLGLLSLLVGGNIKRRVQMRLLINNSAWCGAFCIIVLCSIMYTGAYSEYITTYFSIYDISYFTYDDMLSSIIPNFLSLNASMNLLLYMMYDTIIYLMHAVCFKNCNLLLCDI